MPANRLNRHLHIWRVVLVLLASPQIASCTPKPEPYYYYTGRIDENLLNQVVGAWNTNRITELRLTSAGGDVNAAVRLARFLNEENIRLRISNICFSACAGILALTVDRVVVAPKTLVALHHGPLAHATIRASIGPKGDVTTLKSLEALYNEKGVPLKFSILSTEALDPLCFRESDQGPMIYSKASLWVATKQEMRAIGVRTPPGWPEKSAPVLSGIIELFRREGKPFRGHHSVIFRGEPKVPNLRLCTDEDLKATFPVQ